MRTIGSKLVAERYARAVTESVKDTTILTDDIKILQDALDSPEVIEFLSSAIVSNENKKHIVSEVLNHLENKEIFTGLLNLLIKKDRIGMICEILDEINEIILEDNNTEIVYVRFAEEISDKTTSLIQSKIEGILNKKVIMNTSIDSSIIGGFVAESHSLRIDGSVKRNLIRFKEMIRK